MFALLAQMHERYLLWGAVLSAVALGVSVRLSVIHFLFSIMSATMITQVLLMDKKLGPTLSTIDFLERMRPLASGLLLICVAIYYREALSQRLPQFRAPRQARAPGTSAAARPHRGGRAGLTNRRESSARSKQLPDAGSAVNLPSLDFRRDQLT